AILRVAAHFGIGGMWVRAQGAGLSPAARRVAEGADEAVFTFPADAHGVALAALRRAGFTLIATDSRAERPLSSFPLPSRTVVLVGAEREGVGEIARRAADVSLRIDGTGAVQSLNVATAAAVLFAEFARQHPSSLTRAEPSP